MIDVIVVVAVVAAGLLASLLIRRRRPDAPSQPRSFTAPAQLDRADFIRPEAPWLVVVFSSATCDACADARRKAEVLDSDEVAVQDVEVVAQGDLHRRYGIEAVPITVVVDDRGVVRASFVGPVSATHLWAAVADLREPGSVPPGCGGHA